MFYITDWRLTDKVDYSSMYLRKLQGNYLSIGKNSRGFTYTVCDANTGEFIEGLSLNDLKTLYQEDELIGFYPEYTKSRILIVKCNITQAKLLNEIKFLERKSLDTPDDFPKITCIVENFSNFVFRLETGLGNTNSFTLFDLFFGVL